MDIAPWLALGLTVAAGATGGALGGLAMQDKSTADGELKGSPDFEDAEDGAASKALIADVMFGVAGAAAVATVVLFLLGMDDDDSPATGAVMPTPGGATATVGWRF